MFLGLDSTIICLDLGSIVLYFSVFFIMESVCAFTNPIHANSKIMLCPFIIAIV